jgi:homoserine dehydrogenase
MSEQRRSTPRGQERTAARSCRVAVAGVGTVGRSALRLLREQAPEIELVAICNRDVARKRAGWDGPEVVWTDSFEEVLAQRPDVFVELIGGRTPAESWIARALGAGISVVTANKQVIAESGAALQERAAAARCQLRFEAAVAGGVPVIRGIECGLAGDRLTRVSGILNGTCNYILTRMETSGSLFADALREAQALGYAEADPADDVDGLDARAKIAILAMVALEVITKPSDIACRSITAVSAVDFNYARQFGCTIRQVAWAERAYGGVLTARVGPSLVPLTSALAHAQGSENLVMVRGQSGGETTFGGRGAGGDATAVAVVSDVLAIARGSDPLRSGARTAVTPSPEYLAPFYVRFTVTDRPGIIAALAAVFASHGVNIDAVLQEPGHPAERRPFVMSLDACLVSAVERALSETAQLDFHVVPPFLMPVLASGTSAGQAAR